MKVRMSADQPHHQPQRKYPIQGAVPQQQTPSTINVADVASKVDLVSLAWEYGLDLVPQNNGDYVCLCPFHDDSETPSLRFYVETNTFHCFGCQAGASVFEFVMRMDDIQFPAALNKLAERVGYKGTYTLREVNIPVTDERFATVREKIETEVHRKAKQTYTNLRNSGVPFDILYQNFESLWGWYDRTQYIFDKKVFAGISHLLLQRKLYKFHEEFLKRLAVTESACIKM